MKLILIVNHKGQESDIRVNLPLTIGNMKKG